MRGRKNRIKQREFIAGLKQKGYRERVGAVD